MIQWFLANAAAISALTSLGTLLVWTIYLHIFLQSHRRQRKPMLVINRGQGRDVSTHCLVANMSQEAVYVQSVVADVISGEEHHRAYITDAEDIKSAGNPTGWQRLTRQGPLGSGMMVDMGTFECIFDYVVQSCSTEKTFAGSSLEREATACEITILGIYGSEDLLIGAVRRFDLVRQGGVLEIRAATADTRQIASTRKRRRLSQELSKEL